MTSNSLRNRERDNLQQQAQIIDLEIEGERRRLAEIEEQRRAAKRQEKAASMGGATTNAGNAASIIIDLEIERERRRLAEIEEQRRAAKRQEKTASMGGATTSAGSMTGGTTMGTGTALSIAPPNRAGQTAVTQEQTPPKKQPIDCK